MTARYKILIVDDEDDVEQLVRQKFRRQVREQEYEFVFAKNGLEALTLLHQHPDADAVFSDLNMPQMDGLTLLEQIREAHPILRTVVVSAYNDMDNIRLAMNRGAFDFICKPFDFGDFERTLLKTLQSVEQIRHTLQAVRENDILKMYVDEGVLNFMCCKAYEESLHTTETINATIAFIDICGFTAISEREPSDFVVRLLNRYFDVVVKAVIEGGGYVDKFIGDAVLAVFKGEAHLEHAIRAALSVHNALRAVEDVFSDGQPYSPQVSIGLNTGEVIRGNVGSATLRRFDFTVIGDVVNTAQRLQSVALPGQTLVTADTNTQIGPNFQRECIGERTLRNKANPVTIYAIGPS